MWQYIAVVFAGIFFLASLWLRRQYSFWARCGVPHNPPEFPYGNVKTLHNTEHSSVVTSKVYNQFKGQGKFAGIYMLLWPAIVVTDIDFIKTILVKDFQYFFNRGEYYNERDDPISAHLFNLEDEKWRNLRMRLSPTFTSGKLKYMFPTMIAIADELVKCIDGEMKINSEFDIKDIMARFSTDVIGTVAFGLDCNSLKDENAEFRVKGRRMFGEPLNPGWKGVFLNAYRGIGNAIHRRGFPKDIGDFFVEAVESVISYREKNNVTRSDFMDLLIQIKNKGFMNDEKTDKKIEITMNEITAIAMGFYLGGFDTSSVNMSFALFELAKNPDIQERGRSEIESVLKKHNGEMTYEAVVEMKYIDQIINESLRKYSPGSTLRRIVKQDYKVPDTNIVLPKGTKVLVPIHAIHHDPEFYPYPEVYNPDRFSDEEMKLRNPYTFLPFGDGPRACIGVRFGMMQSRIGLITMLRNFKFTLNSKTPEPMTFKPHPLILMSEGGLYLNLEKIKYT